MRRISGRYIQDNSLDGLDFSFKSITKALNPVPVFMNMTKVATAPITAVIANPTNPLAAAKSIIATNNAATKSAITQVKEIKSAASDIAAPIRKIMRPIERKVSHAAGDLAKTITKVSLVPILKTAQVAGNVLPSGLQHTNARIVASIESMPGRVETAAQAGTQAALILSSGSQLVDKQASDYIITGYERDMRKGGVAFKELRKYGASVVGIALNYIPIIGQALSIAWSLAMAARDLYLMNRAKKMAQGQLETNLQNAYKDYVAQVTAQNLQAVTYQVFHDMAITGDYSPLEQMAVASQGQAAVDAAADQAVTTTGAVPAQSSNGLITAALFILPFLK